VIGFSLRAKLLRWLLFPLSVLWAADAVGTYFSAVRTINDAYDRSLYASVLAISERITLAGERPAVDIPPVALEVLDTAAQERIFYRVGFRSGDAPETFLTGYADLPPPPEDGSARPAPEGAEIDRSAASGSRALAPSPPIASARPVFYEANFHGDLVRVAALRTTFPTLPPTLIVVQVAETLVGRTRLIRALVTRELATQLAAIVLAAFLVWLGITIGLRPLRELSREVADRSAADLTPLVPDEVPREISPVVLAVNDLMGRLRRTLAAQGRFIADASHALRTPLAVLRTEADLALRQQDPEALRQAVTKLRDHVEATGHLATQLLALARAGRRGEQAAAELLDLDAVARQACAAMVPAALERDVDLGYEGVGPLPLLGRSHEIAEALANLVDNALRYGRPKGAVTVSVRPVEGGAACLAVEDDGPGIPPALRSRALEPFHRLAGSPGDGAGLGLAIVQEIAAGHHAELRLLEGAGGRGLRVELHFAGGPVGPRRVTGS
jgi:two-component system sensor histidine kinase TctE